jgi:hypothetical protein
MHGLEAAAGKEAEDTGQEEEESRRDCRPLDLVHRLLDQEEPEEKERQDENGPGLAPRLFLAEEMPEKMKAQV